jgi:broad specificity phosphatase PhoE
MTPPLQIYFIRHGETEWSLSGQHTGRTDLSLTPNGELMARHLAPVLADLAFTRVFTSPRIRAQGTCELAGLGPKAQIEPQLAEWNYGDYEGLRTTEIHARHPEWNIWEDGCPGGDMPQDVSKRADQLIARLAQHSGKVALFSHGQFGRVLAARWIGLPVAQGQHFAIDPASIGILSFESAHPHRRVISLWNARPGTSV